MNDQQRAAMQMACVFIDSLTGMHREVTDERDEVSDALREALAQPQGEWVDLTDDDLRLLPLFDYQAKAVIAKFKEKNTPPVVPQGEPVAWIHRYKTGAEQINTAPPETYVGWTHIPLYTAPPSVEAAIAATKEKAKQACQDVIRSGMFDGHQCYAAAACRNAMEKL